MHPRRKARATGSGMGNGRSRQKRRKAHGLAFDASGTFPLAGCAPYGGSVRRFLERRPPFSRCSWEETRASMAMRSWMALTGSSSTTMTVPDGACYPLMAPSWGQRSAVLELIPIFWAERLRFIPNESTHLKVFRSVCSHFLETFSTLNHSIIISFWDVSGKNCLFVSLLPQRSSTLRDGIESNGKQTGGWRGSSKSSPPHHTCAQAACIAHRPSFFSLSGK